MGTNSGLLFIGISGSIKFDLFRDFNYPIKCVFTRYIYKAKPTPTETIVDTMTLTLEQEDIRNVLKLNISPIEMGIDSRVLNRSCWNQTAQSTPAFRKNEILFTRFSIMILYIRINKILRNRERKNLPM